MKKFLRILLVLIIILVLGGYWGYRTYIYQDPLISEEDRAAINLMPLPAKLEINRGSYGIGSDFNVEIGPTTNTKVESAISRLRKRLPENGGGRITINLDSIAGKYPSVKTDESYSITIDSDGIVINAASQYGALHGLESLAQLVDKGTVPHLELSDEPRFPWRGVMIDVSRHWIPKTVILRNLDAMAAAKLNVLHFHLSDDQGFRLESRTFPLLHEIGSNGKYYTQDDMREIIEYAAERGIRVVPEFDVPGHTKSWLMAYPQYSSGQAPVHWGRIPGEGVFSVPMDPTRESTYEFLDKFVEEMSYLFPDEYYHIGGDEVNSGPWLDNPDIRLFMDENQYEDTHALQAYFNNRLQPILSSHGKKMMGWEEILHPDLKEGIIIQSWTNQKTLFNGVREGREAILSAGWYLDHKLHAEEHYKIDPHFLPGAVDIVPDSGMWKMYDITIQPPGSALESQIVLFDRDPENVFGYFALMDQRTAFKGGSLVDGQLNFEFQAQVGELTYQGQVVNDSLVGEIGFGLLKFPANGHLTGGSDLVGTQMPKIEIVKPLTDQEKQRVLGGEAAMWSEVVSDITIESRIWPRSAAIAEKLWSPVALTNNTDDMYRRLEDFSEYLEEFGLRHRAYVTNIVDTWNLSDDTAVRDMLKITEEAKYYNRMAFLMEMDSLYLPDYPLNHFADASPAESFYGRKFNKLVEQYADTPSDSLKHQIMAEIETFSKLHERLQQSYQESDIVVEVAPLAERLSRLSNIILEGRKGNPEEIQSYIDESLNMLETGQNGIVMSVTPGLRTLLRDPRGD